MKSTIELLQGARKWLSVEEHWCRKTRWGVGETNCAIGALERTSGGRKHGEWYNDPELLPAMTVLERAIIMRFGMAWKRGHVAQTVADFNDILCWRAVLKLFDLAITLEQQDMDRQAKELVDSCTNTDALTPITARS